MFWMPISLDDLEEVREITQQWLEDYNTIRPHAALQRIIPRQFALSTSPELSNFSLGMGKSGRLTQFSVFIKHSLH